ncbi:hypothetical protein DBY73_013645 [Enterobacter sp. RIT418]|nr:hypothetical protein DBY73_013645 [Enterobacter sp. RIT 418]
MITILIYLFNVAKYKAGKYQMAQAPANRFCKFVKQFSFTERGFAWGQPCRTFNTLKKPSYSVR